MKEASIASIALDMAQGLHYMHSLNMLHRDIKPANILLDREVRLYACCVHVDHVGVLRSLLRLCNLLVEPTSTDGLRMMPKPPPCDLEILDFFSPKQSVGKQR